jgi:hypothetical protein
VPEQLERFVALKRRMAEIGTATGALSR